MPRVGLSLGSNLGDRVANLRKAIQSLAALRSSDHLLTSSVYETEPIGCDPGTPAFFNAVVEIETVTQPEELLDLLKEIETAMGRPPVHALNSPREIDLDILYYDDLVLKSEEIEIPHPRMAEREFVLRPLADIRPDLISEKIGTERFGSKNEFVTALATSHSEEAMQIRRRLGRGSNHRA